MNVAGVAAIFDGDDIHVGISTTSYILYEAYNAAGTAYSCGNVAFIVTVCDSTSRNLITGNTTNLVWFAFNGALVDAACDECCRHTSNAACAILSGVDRTCVDATCDVHLFAYGSVIGSAYNTSDISGSAFYWCVIGAVYDTTIFQQTAYNGTHAFRTADVAWENVDIGDRGSIGKHTYYARLFACSVGDGQVLEVKILQAVSLTGNSANHWWGVVCSIGISDFNILECIAIAVYFTLERINDIAAASCSIGK